MFLWLQILTWCPLHFSIPSTSPMPRDQPWAVTLCSIHTSMGFLLQRVVYGGCLDFKILEKNNLTAQSFPHIHQKLLWPLTIGNKKPLRRVWKSEPYRQREGSHNTQEMWLSVVSRSWVVAASSWCWAQVRVNICNLASLHPRTEI